jgi:hypothetical protein
VRVVTEIDTTVGVTAAAIALASMPVDPEFKLTKVRELGQVPLTAKYIA